MPIILSKAAIATGYGIGAILAGVVAAIIAIASNASGIGNTLKEHERVSSARYEVEARADSSMLSEMRKQTCILVAESITERRECLRRAYVGRP